MEPELLRLNLSDRVRNCSAHRSPAQPLGPRQIAVFADGGYAALTLPLLPRSDASTAPCFGVDGSRKCVDPALPSLWDNVPYSYLAVQARPNT